ncbi:N-acetyltransferase family protein [Terasakiella sp. A23]|uniref:GNAT family N-acetyltransferase n=1 Tax=Terasakiella sp. FCG-A23 TaxID=3080561 RepID=UPI0029534750|nr:GNAT family N-acetyltransferase [Terasakiella sp. A23]MDV7340661.1 N-acetyltransferase family protein [Terasakiella sp. A23]
MTNIHIRTAEKSDLPDILDIYSYYIKETVITFEEIIPDLAEMERRFDEIATLNMPYLVCVLNGQIVGYAYGGAFRTRVAYRFSVEHSIYLAKDAQGHGIGSKLMQALITELEKRNIRQLIAVIGDSKNEASIALHKKFGFVHQGTLPATGYKFNRWIDTVMMQKTLGDGDKRDPTGTGLNLS